VSNDEEWLHHYLEEIELSLPFHRYFELFRDSPYAFLLDSAKDDSRLSQNSYLGGDPFLVYEAKRAAPTGDGPYQANIVVSRFFDSERNRLEKPKRVERTGELFSDLREEFENYRIPHYEYAATPTALMAGMVGYFGYEIGYFIEDLPDEGTADLDLNDVCLMFCDVILTKNHKTKSTWISVVGRGSTNEVAQESAHTIRDELLEKIELFERRPPPTWSGPESGRSPKPIEINQHFTEATYCDAINTAKEHIFSGDIFEVCLTHRLDAPFTGDPWVLYQELRRINPAPFAGILRTQEMTVLSSSPERFIKLDHDRTTESRPIKGTRPRGENAAQDEEIRKDLRSSIKDRAENMMIVDLVRNDIGRVSEFGSVKVPELMVVEDYATVFQLVSTIQSKLKKEADIFDLLSSVAPGGSMTGAPKIEAMKIIDRLEPVKRGIYSGGIGFVDFSGSADLNIVIRTFVLKDGRAYFSVGGALVADSDPQAEYQETMDKARALITALENLNGCGLA